jgi:galactan endo-1,6-beta-galactosidase
MYPSALLALAIAVANSPLAIANVTTTISPTTNGSTWEGWGLSLGWWAKAFGDRDDLADILFTTNTTTLRSGWSVPGLGLNIVRYNAGACSTNTYSGAKMVVGPKMNTSLQMDGYWLNWASSDPSSASWSWNVDANQRSMLLKAQGRGADTFELYSRSPMWWMCNNHNPSGADGHNLDNLQPWNYGTHAIYLATIAKYASDHWGVSFGSVEPFHEPSSDWNLNNTQEGCHYNASTQSSVIQYLRGELDNRGLSSTIIAASDEDSANIAITTWNSLNSATRDDVGRINVHGYGYAFGNRTGIYSSASSAGKKIWNSEYDDGDDTGTSLTCNLMLDFRRLNPTAWVYRQAVDGGSGDGLVGVDNGGISGAKGKWYALAQFTRHIKNGYQIHDGGNDDTVAAYDAPNQKLVIVAFNPGVAQNITFDLSKFSQPGISGALVKRWSTQHGESYAYHNDVHVVGSTISSYFQQYGVQTFEVSDVKL